MRTVLLCYKLHVFNCSTVWVNTVSPYGMWFPIVLSLVYILLYPVFCIYTKLLNFIQLHPTLPKLHHIMCKFLGCIECIPCSLLLLMCTVSLHQSVCHMARLTLLRSVGVIWCSLYQMTLAVCYISPGQTRECFVKCKNSLDGCTLNTT